MQTILNQQIAFDILRANAASEVVRCMRRNLTRKEWLAFRKGAFNDLIESVKQCTQGDK